MDYNRYLINPELYYYIFYGVLLILCFVAGVSRQRLSTPALIKGQHSQCAETWLLFGIATLFIGLRPVVPAFGDTMVYALSFFQESYNRPLKNGELLWADIQRIIHGIGGDWGAFSLVVAAGYIGLVFLACRRWFKDNVYVGVLFVMSLFSFFPFGVNTIRNGLALSFVMAGMAMFQKGDMSQGRLRRMLVSAMLFLCAVLTHKTAMLPIACFLCASFCLKNLKIALSVWLLALLASLVIGNAAVDFFMNLGFDDRLDRYVIAGQNVRKMSRFSNTGFRWDFLFYGIIPIIMGYYVIVKKRIKDKTYIAIVNTYILANAFWLLVVRAAYTDRFAFLSWFIYGIVLAYPLLRLNVFRQQAQAMFIILMGAILSTWAFIIMWSIR